MKYSITKNYSKSQANYPLFAGISGLFENKKKRGRKQGHTSSIYEVTHIEGKSSNLFNDRFLEQLKLFTRSQRQLAEQFKIIRKTNLETSKRLARLGRVDEAKKLKNCSKNAYRIFCKKRTWTYFFNNRCNLPICGFCQRTKSMRESKRIANKFSVYSDNKNLKAVGLTLTLKTKSNRGLTASRKKLKDSFNKLKNRKFFDDAVFGGTWRIEETVSENGWHSHLHLVLLVDKNIDQKVLSKTWKEITGNSEIVHIKTIDSDIHSIKNSISYAFKPATVKNMSDKQLLHLGLSEIPM
jgi:hypothetical protein